MKDLLKQIIFEQQELSRKAVAGTISRTIESEWLETSEILIISGIRRCGKSTLMQQMRAKLKEQDFYFNFDDERLIGFAVSDFQALQECFLELFGEQHTYYFDEIQNVAGWETFVRRLYNEGNKVIITGSNARMLSRELGTHLTGRYIAVELFPFSFSEYLQFNNVTTQKKDFYTTTGRTVLLSHFKEYLSKGGFPRYLQSLSSRYLSSLYESIVYRDVMARNALSNEKEIQELIFYLASNATKRMTYTSLGKTIGIRHPETVKNYLEYIQQTYLICQLLKYDPSLKVQMKNPKKVYFIDNAIIRRIGFNATDNIGISLENLVFIELKRRGCDIFYSSGKKECDFVVRQGNRIVEAYQVTLSMAEQKTREREISGLKEAMETFNLTVGYILTMEEKETITTDCGTINVLPVWEWLLQG